MTSATERLRELLDERGVEHYDGTNGTLWGKDASGYRFSADELTSVRMSVHMWCETPEQAIAATLGPGTCHDAAGKQMAFFACSACGATIERKHPRFCYGCGRRVVDE